MNERLFRRNVQAVTGFYVLAVMAGVLLKAHFPGSDNPVYGTFKDLMPLMIAIPAAWLGYCFQRRQTYLKDVRDLWAKLVAAVQEAIQYTHLKEPGQPAYASVNKSLSIATEELRAVFSNLGADHYSDGLYPFESLKNIQATIGKLGFGRDFSSERAATARCEVIEHWKKLRLHFLTELERGLPATPDSPYLR